MALWPLADSAQIWNAFLVFHSTTSRLTYNADQNHFTDAYVRPLVICYQTWRFRHQKETYPPPACGNGQNGYLSDKMKIMNSSYRRPKPMDFILKQVSGHLWINRAVLKPGQGFWEAIASWCHGYVPESRWLCVFWTWWLIYTPPKGTYPPRYNKTTILNMPRTEYSCCGDLSSGRNAWSWWRSFLR